MRIRDVAQDVITLGGHSKLKRAKDRYSACYTEYTATRNRASQAELHARESLAGLGLTVKRSVKSLRQARRILEPLGGQDAKAVHPFWTAQNVPTLPGYVVATVAIQQYQGAVAAAGGASAGGATAMGAWALVSVLGTASTGTAIGTLSGAAATNATLAWFGGGALAAGGAGMAGGATVLGGIVLVPMVLLATWTTYAKAAELERETERVREEDRKLARVHADLTKICDAARTQQRRVESAEDKVAYAIADARARLFRWRVLSHLYRWLRRCFGGNYYKPEELSTLHGLDAATRELARTFVASPASHP